MITYQDYFFNLHLVQKSILLIIKQEKIKKKKNNKLNMF